MPTAQMAEALDIAPGTVLSRLARARDALKNALQEPARAEVGANPAGSVIPLRKRAP
jgi:RNA polymerase sigma-70 factor (ECF subfamily)